MITNVLSAIGGVGVFGVISICLFFVVFTGALLWALGLPAGFLRTMGDLPLADEGTPATINGDSHHE